MQSQLESRLQYLEKQVRQNKMFNLILIGALVLSALFGFRQQQNLEHLKVKSLTVMNENGREFFKVEGDENLGGSMELKDMYGYTKVQAKAMSGGSINLYDNLGNHTIWLTQMKSGGGYVGVKNKLDQEVCAMGTESSGTGYFRVNDNHGNSRIYNAVSSDGGYTHLKNNSGRVVLALFSDSKNSGGINTFNFNNSNTAYFGTSEEGHGVLSLFNYSQNRTTWMGGNKGNLLLYNNYGDLRVWQGVNDWNHGTINVYNFNSRRVAWLGAGNSDGRGYLNTMDGYNVTGVFPN